ncbi:urease accessory protein [Wenxinia saemankumensis]|uniref:Urease accessory protein UreF n=2 Tax=Wenxinia saemankumensis TaxID=1447782 RepID=A0A1M6ANT7_9RHOB|nr:urease accessory protein [Wenxinia saemankumensis]
MTDLDLLTLAQWISPAYPVGAFAYSHGLEDAAAEGIVTPDSLQDWLADLLEFGAGQVEARLIAAAWHADPGVIPVIDATARALAGSRERLIETERQGAAFARITGAVWDLDLPPLAYPVALGRAAALRGLPLAPVQMLHLQAWLANLAAAAQRLMPLGQTGAQRIVAALAPRLPGIAAATGDGALSALSSCAFLSDIAAMRHETLQPRIFAT